MNGCERALSVRERCLFRVAVGEMVTAALAGVH